MAEETAVDFGGLGASAGPGEDNLSMPLGDFMAFLETELTPPDGGGEVDEEPQQPGFSVSNQPIVSRVNQGCMEIPADTSASGNAFQSHDEMLENAEFWSNYSNADPSQCQMEVNMKLNHGQVTVDCSEASPYDLFSNADLYNQSRIYMGKQHFADASNHDTFEDASGPPYEHTSNGSYLGPQTMYPDQTQLQVANDMKGTDTPMNTYDMSAEQSGLSEIKWEGTDSMLGDAGQDGNHFIPTAMFSLTQDAAMPGISCAELSMGDAAESIRNGNSSCVTVQEEHVQAECGNYPHPDYVSVDMVAERSLHDLPHDFSQNNEQFEMEQFENICESGSMQMGSPDQYCDDTSLSDIYIDVSSPESVSCEQNQTEDFCFKSESSTDSSPVPSSINSTTEDADKYFGHTSKQLLDSKVFPISQQPFNKMGYQKPLASHKQYDYRIGNSSTQGNSSRGCFSMDGNGAPDLCLLEGNQNPAPDYRLSLQRPIHHNFQQSTYPKPILPTFGGMRYKPHDERMTLRLALQDISQPMSEANPPNGVLAVPLLRHQKIALSWMVQKETSSSHCSGGILADDQGLGKTVSAISLILTERPPVPQSSTVKQEPCEAVTLDDDDDDDCAGPQLKKPSLMSCPEAANDTVKKENPIVAVKTRPAAGTLVVCPTSVLRQWAGELKNKVTSKANLSFLIYHGSNRTKDPNELTKYDVVLTTYSIVSMEVPKQSNPDSDNEEKGKPDRYGAPVASSGSKKRKTSSKKTKNGSAAESNLPERPLAKVAWFRVILDEAQSIKNYRTQVARACWGLRAKRRWCLSGTPIQNAVEDLYSYFRFLRYDPYAVYKQFCTMIKLPVTRNPINGYKKLQAVLKTVMLRRTKATMLDGKPIISLPPKTVSLKTVDFTSEERTFYNTLEAESREQFKEYAAAGTVKQNYVNILLMLLRLRQACDHPHLVRGYESTSSWMSSLEMAKKLPIERQQELLICLQSCSAICALCNDAPEDAVVTLCGHVFCNQCILEQLTGDDSMCPVSNCRVRLNVTSLFSRGTLECSLGRLTYDFKPEDSSGDMVHAEKRPRIDSSYASSKVRTALDIILSLPKIDNKKSIGLTSEKLDRKSPSEHIETKITEKAIVFSQWTRMLDLLEDHLKASHVTYRRLDGTMSVSARDKAVNDFNTVPEVSVMIMSLKAASLGLNMVAACHVLMLDLWWNPTTEDQAVDRAHRIGQTRPVTVSRLTVKDTVEDRILALQEKKREMVASAFGEDRSGSRQTRLTVEDLNYLFMV